MDGPQLREVDDGVAARVPAAEVARLHFLVAERARRARR